ncbi:MAG: hypothetical protein PHV37_01925 [Candidatus Gastranaerophilales bacterium]|nr:hypothetical protein [Candidatus Gastranaerophilales bacterium]
MDISSLFGFKIGFGGFMSYLVAVTIGMILVMIFPGRLDFMHFEKHWFVFAVVCFWMAFFSRFFIILISKTLKWLLQQDEADS